MYAYEWDSSTGGYILTPMPLAFSKEPRPVYYKELDILGFDKYWDYDKNDSFPYMWAEANNYYYRGRLVAKTKGGSLYTPPELVLIEDPEPEGYPLRFVDIPAMVDKNRQLMEQLVQETIKKIYNTFIEYQDKVDVFYVAFSGGKDSVVALDLVQRALPHNCFKVLFGDTGMEFPDTYETVEKIKQICAEEKIEFLQAKSKLKPENTWQIFGPPAVTIRWCCSVHKTTPQIMQLREVLQKPDFTGMAFTGVRGDESLSRSEYDAISYGGKHSGQYSCHPILEWNTAELFLYIYENGLTFNNAYKKGNTSISGHVVIITYQCEKYLRFTDPRISESGRLVIVDGNPDNICNINFISPTLSDIFTDSYSGIQNIGTAIDSCFNRDAYIATAIDKSSFAESVFHISQVNNSYDILRNKDSRTEIVPQACGLPEQWDYVLHQMGKSGTWTTVIVDNFGSENNLLHVISEYPKFDVEKRWLYYIALLICGVKNNDYLKLALNKTSKSSELIKNVFRSVLDIDWKSENYQKLYRQRKSLISELKKPLPETIDFCKILSTKGEDEIYYLTDLTQPEKEKIIKWLSNYGVKYSKDELVSILMNVYPDLAYYLSSYRYRNEFLNTYFENYKYQKITNRILPSFDKVVEEQAIKMDFVTILKPRTAYVDKLDTQNAQVFFVDAMGVEYLSFIQQKCSEYGLSANISCARCELPSLTVFNKEFVDVLKDKGCPISDIKDLDDIKHHGKDSFDYEKEKTPIYLIKELEIIDDLLTKIKASILAGPYNKAIIISDHGASRLAVLHETENIWNMETKGEHSGRCCKISEIDDKPDFAIEESGYWILANYDRFRGSRRANVEVHGGASMEEVAVPIIEITQKASNIEAFIVDESRVLTLGAKEYAIIKIYVGIRSNNISIKLDGNYYNAEETAEPYIYSVELKNYSKKGKFSIDILAGGSVLASGQQFEIEKKGMSQNNMFDF